MPAVRDYKPMDSFGEDAASIYDDHPRGDEASAVALLEQLPVGTSVKLAIEVPHLWEPLTLAAEVAWARAEIHDREVAIGLRFEQPPPAILRQLAELLETHQY